MVILRNVANKFNDFYSERAYFMPKYAESSRVYLRPPEDIIYARRKESRQTLHHFISCTVSLRSCKEIVNAIITRPSVREGKDDTHSH